MRNLIVWEESEPSICTADLSSLQISNFLGVENLVWLLGQKLWGNLPYKTSDGNNNLIRVLAIPQSAYAHLKHAILDKILENCSNKREK